MEKDLLQSAVQQLITHHTDFEKLLKEIVVDKNGDRYVEAFNNTEELNKRCSVDTIVNSVKQHVSLGGCDTSSASASFIAQKFKELFTSKDSSTLLVDPIVKEQVHTLAESVKYLLQDGSLSKQHFNKYLTETMVPLEVVWMFHVENIMSLDEYITCNLSRPKVIGKVAYDIADICSSTEVSYSYRKSIINGIMNFLVKQGYMEQIDPDNAASRGMKKVSCALLDSITKKIIQLKKPKDICVFMFLLQQTEESDENIDCLKKYCTRQIGLILSLSPNLKVSDALMQQTKWSYAKMDNYRTQIYRELLLPFTTKEAIKILQEVLEEQEVNWESVLSFAATLLLCYPDAPALLRVLSIELITVALEKCELDGLIVGFLLARQAAVEGPHVFQNYQQWFYATFGDQQSSPANTKKTFAFLIKFLSDIVPYESVHHLKAHIWKQPYVPAKCRPVLSDYVSLVKTRLMDLGEPLEEISIFSEASTIQQSDNIQGDNVTLQAKNDIEKALKSFLKAKKIPASVMEASIFRKPYFIGRFLPALLTPRPLPDKPDVRMQFIEVLLKSEKIPQVLYTSYTKACQKISSQLFEGVFEQANEDGMEDLLLTPWQQYEKSLEVIEISFVRLKSKASSRVDPNFTSQLAVLYEKMCLFLKIEDDRSTIDFKEEILIDISQPSLQKSHLMVVDAILTTIANVFKEIPTIHHIWLEQLLLCICRNKEIHKNLCVRLLHLICLEDSELVEVQVRCLVSVCVVLFTNVTLCTVFVKVDEAGKKSFEECVSSNLNIMTCSQMLFSLKFITFYMEYMLTCYSGKESSFLPQTFADIFKFLVNRAKFSERYQELHFMQAAWTIYQSSHFQLCGIEKISFEDWVNLELKINPEQDILDDTSRQNYYEKMIFTVFLPRFDASQKHNWAGVFCTEIALSLVCPPIKATLNPCNIHKYDKFSTMPTSRLQLVNLLQRLTQYLQSNNQTDLWLADFYKRVQDQNSVLSLSVLDDAVKLGSQLSPYLLFVNSLQPRIPCKIESTVSIINQVLKEHTTEGPVLKRATVIYIMQAFISVQHLQLDWQFLFTSCPIIMASIQYHWHDLESWLTVVSWNNPIALQIKEICQVNKFVSRYLSGIETDSSRVFQGNPLLITMSLLSYLQTDDSMTKDLPGFLGKDSNLCSHVSAALLNLITWNDTKNYMTTRREQEFLMPIFLDCSGSLIKKPNIFSLLCSSATERLEPLIFFKYLLKMKGQNFTRLLSNDICITVILQYYIECTELYEKGLEFSEQLSDLCRMVEPLSFSFLQECRRWLEEFLTQVPYNTLELVKKNVAVIDRCDPNIKKLILV